MTCTINLKGIIINKNSLHSYPLISYVIPMQRRKHDHLEWLEFDILSDIPKLHHAVILRQGVSGPSSSDKMIEDEGFKQDQLQGIQRQLQHHSKRMVRGIGCHQDKIALVDGASSAEIPLHDGLMSAIPGHTLIMKHADCQIALFYDPVRHAVANVHSGWRGSVKNIYAKAIDQMHAKFGSKPADLLVCISPSLGPDNAEFINYASELPEEFWQFQVKPLYFDFWSISEWQLQNAGILPHHIEIARLCTYSNPHDFFSYRRDKTIARQNATYITLT